MAFTSLANYLVSSFAEPNGCATQLIPQIRQILDRYAFLTKLVAKNSTAIEGFLCEKLVFLERQKNFESVSDTPVALPHSPVKDSSTSRADPTSVVTTPVKTRRDCNNCSASKKVNSAVNLS